MTTFRQRIRRCMETDAIQTITQKFTVRDRYKVEHDFYLKIGWYHGRPVLLELVLPRAQANRNSVTDMREVECYGRMLETSRGALEIICAQATELLQTKQFNLEDIEQMWTATRFDPSGTCRQVEMAGSSSAVLSPLDALAKLFKQSRKKWEVNMAYTPSDEEIETMLSECIEALEERPDDFTGWERTFLEDLEEKNELGHLSEKEIAKLEEIYEERDCG